MAVNDGLVSFRASVFQPEKTERLVVMHSDPGVFEKRQPRLPSVDLERPATAFAGPNDFRKPLVEQQTITVLPGLQSNDLVLRSFLEQLQAELNEAIPHGVDADGFSTNGVAEDFFVCSPAGCLQSPASLKMVDNTKLREDLQLEASYSARHKQIARTVWKLLLRGAIPSAVRVPRKSSSGFRLFSHDPQYKFDYAIWKTDKGNYSRFLRAVEQKDVSRLANDYGVIYATMTQKRTQIDRPGKIRYANDLEYALTGGRKGRRFQIDSRAIVDGQEWVGFTAKRVRLIDAGPWTINCDGQISASSHMAYIFAKYGKTFHVNTKEEIKSRIDGFFISCWDVTEFDQSMSEDSIVTVLDIAREYWPSAYVDSLAWLMAAPYFYRPVQAGHKPGWVGSWAAPFKRRCTAGNRSGHAWTSLIAKGNKVVDTLCVIDSYRSLSDEQIERILMGEHPEIRLINNGDDEIVCFLHLAESRMFHRARSVLANGHYKVDLEKGQGFSGYNIVRKGVDSRGKPVYDLCIRANSVLQRMYSPERSIGSAMRRFWPLGMRARLDLLAESDVGKEVLVIHNHVYSRVLEPKIGALSSHLSTSDLEFGGLSRADIAVLDDENKLHYAYSVEELSPEIRDRITAHLPADLSADFLYRYYKGEIYER